MYPVQSQVAQQSARPGNPSSFTHTHASVPDGRDLPDQRLARNDSRAVPSPQLELQANGSFPVAHGLARLLGLDGDTFDLNSAAPVVFSASAHRVRQPRSTIDPNIPLSSRRYLDKPVADLLAEVAQRAIGEGPEDVGSRENPGLEPDSRRLGDMVAALGLTPGREHDSRILRNSGLALYAFFFDYRALVEEVRAKRPDLAPVLVQWSAGLARAAISQAMAIPLGADGEPQYVSRLYDPIIELVRQPLQSYIPDLEWRLGEQQREAFMAQSREFFAFVSTPINREAPRQNRVLGVASNEMEGPDVRAFLAGSIVFSCTEAELVKHLQMIPAGRLKLHSALYPHVSVVVEVSSAQYSVAYPNRASGTTIKHVTWRDPAGVEHPVLVANWHGTHSFSLDRGQSWRATGATTSAALDRLRADGWRQLMADRWHAHREGALAAFPGIGGR